MDMSTYSVASLQQFHHQGVHMNVSFRTGPSLFPVVFTPKRRANTAYITTEFEFAEHGFLGDSIYLKLNEACSQPAGTLNFSLPNGLMVTYGQINGLAGDFYATEKPISDGRDETDQARRFIAAWETLAVRDTRQPGEAQEILKVLDQEVAAVNQAIARGQDPSTAYANLDDPTVKLERITATRPHGQPSYLGLSEINWDHFGADARTAYAAGHTVAIQEAARSTDVQNLMSAYALNAFADHFIEDLHSAGHIRTPRRYLHSLLGDADLCAKAMHDEDCSIGISVRNPRGDRWVMYGDKRLLDRANTRNRNLCLEAVQQSANEIYEAWLSRRVPAVADFGVWRIAPMLDSAEDKTQQRLAPLFTTGNKPERRQKIGNRQRWKFTHKYWYWTTLIEIRASRLWVPPIHL